ncbi:hypothetical protein QUT52_22610, partial [Xanthomonas citri pv. citri]
GLRDGEIASAEHRRHHHEAQSQTRPHRSLRFGRREISRVAHNHRPAFAAAQSGFCMLHTICALCHCFQLHASVFWASQRAGNG